MLYKTFDYTDKLGKTTTRQVLVVQPTSDTELVLDVAELNDHQVGEFAVRYDSLYQEWVAKVKALQHEFELNYKIRRFFPDQMHSVTAESI